ncbi:MAG: FIST C-terminal domain-containing protein, partial [Bdellovibrionales bacterium]|nr:FIST C-terminal domain-containing protein [Bdellovibrionales bacterium]
LLFVDGLSEKEELVTEIVGSKLGSIPLVGGSSGDGLRFKKTYIYFKGQMLQDVAVVIFVTTYIPFKVFKTQHFNGSEVKFVITESQPEKRLVFEINGEPAAKAYAQAIGVAVEDLNSKIFAKYPLVLKVADSYHVRSIQSSNADFSLKFYCAIENGLVLSLADKNDIIDSTLNYFKNIEEKLQEITCSLLFECVLRRLEVDEMSVEEKRKLYSIYSGINGVGFHTYGEQYGSVHVNQTLTGVVFGPIR